jgi:hypothetical protein
MALSKPVGEQIGAGLAGLQATGYITAQAKVGAEELAKKNDVIGYASMASCMASPNKTRLGGPEEVQKAGLKPAAVVVIADHFKM